MDRVLNAVEQIDNGNSKASLRYHGLSRNEMVAGLRELLSALVNKYTWQESTEFLSGKPPVVVEPFCVPKAVEPEIASAPAQTGRKALRDFYLAAFPEAKILDVCWAAGQRYSEWKRWLRSAVKDGSAPDRAFRALLKSGKPPQQYRKQPRPNGWK